MSKQSNTHSSFPKQQVLQEAWNDFLKRGASGKYNRQAPQPTTAPVSEEPPTIQMPPSPQDSKGPEEVSLSQIVVRVSSKKGSSRGVVKLDQQLKSFIDNNKVSDILTKNLVGKQVVTQIPPELQSLITIDRLRTFIRKKFPKATQDDIDALLQSVEDRKIIAEHIIHCVIFEETQRVLNEKK